jgi:glutamyl-tRNA synthetase/nondiscriminating glutamyl-tRNA synthetase
VRLRFAPSPTGQLHVGNARTALFNWLLARGHDGAFILRIEDTDVERSTAQSEAGILEDLRWLGLDWDEGPDVGGPHGPYRQSDRLHLYRSYANELLEAGRAYYCFCTPDQIEAERRAALAAGKVPKYSGACRDIPPEEARRRIEEAQPAAVRFRVPDDGEVTFTDGVRGELVFGMEMIGDPVLLRSDGRPAYNFAVVVDDAYMEVTHVVRGEDHISNTPRQILLYQALAFHQPEFAHLSLVLGPDHTPLSKRHGATSVAEFRARGYLPEALVNYLALIGWSPGGDDEILPVEEIKRRFSLDRVGKSAGVFDEAKLAWVNRHYLKMADPARLARLSAPFFQRAQFLRQVTAPALDYLTEVVGMASASVDRLEEMPQRLRFIFDFDAVRAASRPDVRAVMEEPGAAEVVRALADDLREAPRLDRQSFRAAAARVRQRTGQKGRQLFHPIRVALTGEPGGPELDQAVPAIDRGADLVADAGFVPIAGCRERVAAFAKALEA